MGIHTTRRWRGLIIFFVLSLLLLAAFFLFARHWLLQLPSVQQQIQAANASRVFISNPENHSSWPLDANIPIQIKIDNLETAATLLLYADDKLINQQEISPTNGPVPIHWQPGKSGIQLLTARLITGLDQTYLSTPITLNITEAVGAIVQYETAGDETLSGISERFQVDAQEIQKKNPRIDFAAPLPGGITIQVPVITPPLTAAPEPQPQNFVYPDMIANPVPENHWSRLKIVLDGLTQTSVHPPAAPNITGLSVGCDAQLTISDQADNEDGFFVYRTISGKTDSQKIITLAANENNQSIGYLDPQQSGDVLYSVSAYNSAGESSSAPIQISFGSECSALLPIQSSNGSFDATIKVIEGNLSVIDHYVHFQQPVDLAYLYISVNQQDWERIPAGNQKFLSGAGDKFDLDIYLDQIINKNPATKLEIDMEIWGWNGKKLIDYGSLHVSVRRTVLRVCALQDVVCEEDLLRTEINLPPALNLSKLFYAFEWDTADRDETIDYVWQVSAKPYSGEEIRSTQSLIISRGVYNTSDLRFKFNLSYLYKEGQFDLGSWPYMSQNFDSNFFDDVYPPDTPFTLYVRVLPFDEDNNKLPTSNTVILHYHSEWAAPLNPTYASNLPSRYQIEFLPETYRAPILVRESEWGCIIYDENIYFSHPLFMKSVGISDIDIQADPQNCNSQTAPTCNGKQKPIQYTSGTKVCPNTYSEPSGVWNDIKALASGIWNGVTSAWDHVAESLENAKQYIAEQVASVIPGCGEECTSWIKTGLEAAFTAVTGIPPTLPNYDDLMDEGITYAVDLAAQEIGPLCDELCKEALKAGLEEVIQQAKTSQPAPGCANAEEAHARGKEPFCPYLQGVAWHPAPGSIYEPALIQVKISRPPASGNIPEMNIPQDLHDKYRIGIYTYGFNDSRIGDWFPICGFHEGLDGDKATGYNDAGGGYANKRQINNPLEAALYLPQALPLPRLSQGESLEIPLVMEAQTYWRLNHLYDVNQKGVNFEDFYNNCGDDWPYLYFDGFSQFTAVEECLNDQNQWVPCSGGGLDGFETMNPPAP